MAKWAVIIDNITSNVVEWDGVIWDPEHPELGGWTPPEDATMVEVPFFQWTVPGVYNEADENGIPDPASGLYVFTSQPGRYWPYIDGVWYDPYNERRWWFEDDEWHQEPWSPE